MTSREFFNAVIAYVDGDESADGTALREKSLELIQSLDSKNEKRSSADSKQKKESSARRDAVLAYLRSVNDFASRENIAEATGITPNQATAACTALAKEDLVVKVERKVEKSKRMFYRAVMVIEPESEEIVEEDIEV